MKRLLLILGILTLLGTSGCIIRDHGPRGGYYGPREYGHGEYHHDYDGDWDRH